MRVGRWFLLAIAFAAAACASTIGPVIPSVQVLVVLDSMDDTLRIIPVDSPNIVHKLLIDVAALDKHALALRGQLAAFSAHGSFAYSLDMASGVASARLLCSVQPQNHGPIEALAFADDGNVYAAQPTTNGAPHFDPRTCGVGEAEVHGARAFVSARSLLFIVAGTPLDCAPSPAPCTESPSWLKTPADSIPLSLPGNARGGVLASDGFIYVINAGAGRPREARLSQVDPVQKTERNVYNGFGTLPQYIATDGPRVFVASAAEGLMVYNTMTNTVERDANSAIPLSPGVPRGLAADDLGRVYALIGGPCAPTGGLGTIRIFGADLVPKNGVTVGRCPVAIAVTDIPATLYHFVDF